MANPAGSAAGSVDSAEVARFDALARRWWDPSGPMAPLHRLNPLRLGYLRDRLALHFGRDTRSLSPFTGLSLLDIGCGGGLVSEPMARLGFKVIGIDAAPTNLAVAERHAAESDLAIDYREAAAEDLAEAGESYDAVLALEVVEHVADPSLFLAAAARLVRPGGAFIGSTLNRTPKSFLLGIVGAEYVLRWLPPGTHRWDRFMRPSEFAAALRGQGLVLQDLTGASYDLLARRWRLGHDLEVNYFLHAAKLAG